MEHIHAVTVFPLSPGRQAHLTLRLCGLAKKMLKRVVKPGCFTGVSLLHVYIYCIFCMYYISYIYIYIYMFSMFPTLRHCFLGYYKYIHIHIYIIYYKEYTLMNYMGIFRGSDLAKNVVVQIYMEPLGYRWQCSKPPLIDDSINTLPSGKLT